MKTIKLEKTALEYGISETQIHRLLLRHSNVIGVILMDCDDEGVYVVPEAVVNEINRTRDIFTSYIIPLEDTTLLEAVKTDRGCYIYFLYDDSALIYIGQTVNLRARVVMHQRDKEFNNVKFKTVPEADMTLIEHMNIRHYRPSCNSDIWSNSTYFKFLLRSCDFNWCINYV